MPYQPEDRDLRIVHQTETAIQAINDLITSDVEVAAFVLDSYLADTLEVGFRHSHDYAQRLSEADVGAMSLLELRSTLTAVLKRLKGYPLDIKHVNLLKILLKIIWDGLDPVYRQAFVARLDENAEFIKKPVDEASDPVVKAMDIEEIFHMWPPVHASQEEGWAREFAKDVMKKRFWKNWRPSAKQEKIIRRMYDEWMKEKANNQGGVLE